MKIISKAFLVSILLFVVTAVRAQMITGVWHGRMDRQNVEVKMVLQGDSITGTSYYYNSTNQYQRFSIKGFIDQSDNSVVWWDDQLLDEKTKGLNLFRKKTPASARADFNCPGGGIMKLDGNTYRDEEQQKPDGDVHLQKTETAVFKDEWDFVIENYIVGANDPDLIDSISLITKTVSENTVVPPEEKKPTIPTTEGPVMKKQPPVTTIPVKTETRIPEVKAPTIEQKFVTREKVFTKEIPITADSFELRFYDNAEIDGDSISLFLNNKLLFEHIKLTGQPHTIKLAAKDLQEINELVMVAENLGAIPPNTSYMLAIVGEKRFDAQLASSEGSSAMIRLVKKVSRF
jgi:hypothetical protein